MTKNSIAPKRSASVKLTAEDFIKRLYALKTPEDLEKLQRYFKTGKGEYGEGDKFIGVRMGSLFALAKQYTGMPVKEIEKLLKHPIHEVRTGAVSIMDFEARHKKTSEERRKDLFNLYLKRHDGINNWDLVDRAAPHVIGGYLFDKPRKILYKLAKSKNMWERRTAIISTLFFIRKKETDDTLKIAAILLNDKEDLIHKGVGGLLRCVGDVSLFKLTDFLDRHASGMPRVMLRNATEHLNKKQRSYYLNLK